MTKTDDILLELRRAVSKFTESVFPFEYDNKTCRLVDSYVASPWTRCDVCGHHPIKNVFVIRCGDGQRLRVGSSCIDALTDRQVSELFEKFRTKLANIISNRRYIDGLASILTAYKNGELPFQISENEIELLQKAFERMCNGFNLNRTQEQLAERYSRNFQNIR